MVLVSYDILNCPPALNTYNRYITDRQSVYYSPHAFVFMIILLIFVRAHCVLLYNYIISLGLGFNHKTGYLLTTSVEFRVNLFFFFVTTNVI